MKNLFEHSMTYTLNIIQNKNYTCIPFSFLFFFFFFGESHKAVDTGKINHLGHSQYSFPFANGSTFKITTIELKPRACGFESRCL